MKEKRYVLCHICADGTNKYFVGLFNFGKTYKIANKRCYLKGLTRNEAFSLAKQFFCSYVTEYTYENGKQTSSKTFKIETL